MSVCKKTKNHKVVIAHPSPSIVTSRTLWDQKGERSEVLGTWGAWNCWPGLGSFKACPALSTAVHVEQHRKHGFASCPVVLYFGTLQDDAGTSDSFRTSDQMEEPFGFQGCFPSKTAQRLWIEWNAVQEEGSFPYSPGELPYVVAEWRALLKVPFLKTRKSFKVITFCTSLSFVSALLTHMNTFS